MRLVVSRVEKIFFFHESVEKVHLPFFINEKEGNVIFYSYLCRIRKLAASAFFGGRKRQTRQIFINYGFKYFVQNILATHCKQMADRVSAGFP